MKRRLGNFETATLAANANNCVIPYNARRRYLYLGSTAATAIQVQFGASTAASGTGMRIAAGQDGIELRYEDVGDLVTQPVSIWNAGAANTAFAWVEAWDYDDL